MLWRIKDWWHRFKEELAISVVWHLPRTIVYWSTVRVAVSGCQDNPGDRKVSEVLQGWQKSAQ
jgi:hypothetical protein